MSQMQPLAVVGNVNVDLIMGPTEPWPKPGSEVMVDHDELRVGGSAGNAALTWAALGYGFQIAAHTGSDQFGTWLREAFAPHAARWPITDGSTTLSVGLTHPDGERTFFTTRGHLAKLTWPQVRDSLNWPDLAGGYLLLCGCFLMDALVRDLDALFDHATARGIKVALDTGWPLQGWTPTARANALHWVSRSDCLLFNEVEAMAVSGCQTAEQAALSLRAQMRGRAQMQGGALVVIKCGAAGALLHDDSAGTVRVAAPVVKVVDTIGAGDVFNAAFLGGLSQGLSPVACLGQGVRCASTAISTLPRRYGSAAQPAPSGITP
ncbi:MAG: PfkB family carbohydrate kinase [Paracoccaceae bacterium]